MSDVLQTLYFIRTILPSLTRNVDLIQTILTYLILRRDAIRATLIPIT